MAKVGYIFKANYDDTFDANKAWMQQYGCVHIVEEAVEQEILRPQWKELIASLERGDEIVVAKFSNAVRGIRELAAFIELCRIKVVRIISIQDGIDTRGKLFPETTVAQVLEMVGALPEETAALRKVSAHIINLQLNIKSPQEKKRSGSRQERNKNIVDMYNNGHSLDDILAVSGFKSRSSVFRILNKFNVKLNRGNFSGPLGKRKQNEKDDSVKE